jgi:lipopolysaccharide transport system ATP-binding protein
MSNLVVRVENLGKKYSLGYEDRTFRETLTDAAQQLAWRRRTKKNAAEEIWALRDVNFEVKQGEVIGIIGRNGAGKSTLLKILSRITEPTVGRVRINGRVGSLLEVGSGFHSELTGRENVYLNGAILGMTRAEIQRKFDEIVDFAEVHRFLDTPVKRYSSGMYVRLAFAVAAHLEPEILIIDEVLAVGDVEFQKKCMGKMNDVSQREGRTVLFVSHQMAAVERLCSRALLIDKGKLRMESSDVRSVTRSYLSGEGGDDASARSEWRNSGNEFDNTWFQPQRLFLADSDGVPLKMPVRSDAEIWLHIEANFKTLDPALSIGYAIYAETGEVLYRSYQTDSNQEAWPRLQLGGTVLRTKIPPRLFNEGTHRIDLIAALYFREWILEPDTAVPSVSLVVQGGLSVSPYRNLKRVGLIAPVVPWELWKEK